MNNKLQILNKTFENKKVRTVWNSDEEKYYISVVDIVGILSESSDGRKYWNKLKQRLKEEENETVTNCHQLKLITQDGKKRLTDVVDLEEMFRIIESIPSKKAEPIKLWLARLGNAKESVIEGSTIAKNTREQIEAKTGKKIVTNTNNKNLKQIKD